MEYSTYWSLLDTPSHSIKPNSIALIVMLVAALCWILVKRIKKGRFKNDKPLLVWSTGVITALAAIMFFVMTFIYPDNIRAAIEKMLNSSQYHRVEGVVTSFERTVTTRDVEVKKVPISLQKTIETFTVDSVQFAYGDEALGRFNSFSETNNKVIYDGQTVRITYGTGSVYGEQFNTIVKLEIAK